MFTDQKPWVVTRADTLKSWRGSPGHFRCGLCGHRFVEGDVARWQYTNDLSGYGGNPLVCQTCDGPDVVERWKQHVDEFKHDKYWMFKRH